MKKAEYEIIEPRTRLPLRFHLDTVANGNVPWDAHWHKTLEFLYMSKGTTCIRIGDRKIIGKSGDFIIIPSSTIHSTSSIDGLSEYYTLIIYSDFLDSLEFDYEATMFETPVRDPKIDEYMSSLIQIVYSDGTYANAQIIIKVLQLLIYLFDNYKSESIELTPSKNMSMVQKALRYIEENYERNISSTDISNHLGISESYFRHIFKDITNMPPIKYINSIRCKKALEFIKTGNYSMTEIAEKCGFRDLSYFSKTFKKYMNTAPSKMELWKILI